MKRDTKIGLIKGSLILVLITIIYGIKFYKEYMNNNSQTIAYTKTVYTKDEIENIVNGAKKDNETTNLIYDKPFQITKFDLAEMTSMNRPIILDFGSDDCQPCLDMKPVLMNAYDKYKDSAIIHFLDVYYNKGAEQDFPISSLPTQFLFNSDGTPLEIESLDESRIEKSYFIEYVSIEDNEHSLTDHIGGLTEEEIDYLIEVMTLD